MPSLKETIESECYKDCPRKEQFERMAIESISLEDVDKLYQFLQGKLPDDIIMKCPPRLSERQAFRVIWFLQEEMGILPSNYERCKTCGILYDTYKEGGGDNHCDDCHS